MAWVQIQKAQLATWDDYARVAEAAGVDDERPEGLIFHAAGEVDGRWQAVSVWESREAHDRFRDTRLMPAVMRTLSDELVSAGPPPEESFEAKHVIS